MSTERTDDSSLDESTELLLYWQTDMNRECREVRSHRAPPRGKKHHRLALTASVLMLGIAVIVSHETTPSEPPIIATGMGERDYGFEFDAQEAQRERERAQEREASRGGMSTRAQLNVTRSETPKSAPLRLAERPVVHPLPSGRITSCFGPRWGSQHNGLDISAPTGTPIAAVASGVVLQSGWNFNGFGYSVIVRHDNGYVSVYGHASRTLVHVGQRVAVGEKIALVGSTGDSTGPHLHLGIAHAQTIDDMWSTWIDPRGWLIGNGVAISGCG